MGPFSAVFFCINEIERRALAQLSGTPGLSSNTNSCTAVTCCKTPTSHRDVCCGAFGKQPGPAGAGSHLKTLGLSFYRHGS